MDTRVSGVRLNDRQLEQLLAEIEALPTQRVGDCLDPVQMACYATEDMDIAGREAVERHTESCSECAETLEIVFSGLREHDRKKKLLPWLATQIEGLGAPLRAMVRGLALPLSLPNQFRLNFVGQHYDTPATLEGATPDGRLRWRFVEDRDEVVVSLETTVPELLLNPNIRLRWGRAVETVMFEERAGHIVGWAVFSTKRQLANLTSEDVPRLELVEGGVETPA